MRIYADTYLSTKVNTKLLVNIESVQKKYSVILLYVAIKPTIKYPEKDLNSTIDQIDQVPSTKIKTNSFWDYRSNILHTIYVHTSICTYVLSAISEDKYMQSGLSISV